LNIIIDTREKKDKITHLTNYFDAIGVKWYRSKLICGDYQNPKKPLVIIDRKQSLQEVCGNVTLQHDRFVRELELAKELGYKMIVLVEEPNITSLNQVPSWYNWRKKKNPRAVSGKTLFRIMSTMSEKYDITWQFTTKANCGKKILELLEVQE
jgi:ERCC4-type nuclease